MTNTSNVKPDMDYRPDTYWGVSQEILARIKGEHRRRAVEEAILDGRLEEIPAVILDDQLADEVLDMVARFDLSFLDGEYLDEYLPGEVEIARVVQAGMTSVVFSIRARRCGKRICYRVINDCDSIVAWGHQKSSTRPLTLEQLVTLIHSAQDGSAYDSGLIHGSWIWKHQEDDYAPEEATASVSVSSLYYDQLELWYEQHRQEWIHEMEQHEADVAGREVADAAQSAGKEDGYRVDEDLVDALLDSYTRLTREASMRLIEESGE